MAFGLLRGGVELGFFALAERERESEREIIAEMRRWPDGLSQLRFHELFIMEWKVPPP